DHQGNTISSQNLLRTTDTVDATGGNRARHMPGLSPVVADVNGTVGGCNEPPLAVIEEGGGASTVLRVGGSRVLPIDTVVGDHWRETGIENEAVGSELDVRIKRHREVECHVPGSAVQRPKHSPRPTPAKIGQDLILGNGDALRVPGSMQAVT